MNAAKFHPPVQGLVLRRERLINRLMSWEDRKLVLIHAEAGQGKSTLAADYARSQSIPWVWYNLDREDDSPGIFLSCLGKTLQRALPNIFPRVPSLPRSAFAEDCADTIIRRCIAQLFSPLTAPCLIIFDDFKASPSPRSLHTVIRMLLEESGPHIRIMILSRTSPELEIAALRARRGVGQLVGTDLRFNDVEAHELFTTVFGMQVGQNDAALINRTAEGWPAALVLLHEYLSPIDPDAWTAALRNPEKKGFSARIYEYLAQEVFAHLPGHLQQFLLKTSVPRYLPLSLVDVLWKNRKKGNVPAAGAVIEQLRARNLFVSGLDETGLAIRYHSLFRDFLQKKLLDSAGPAEIARLYSSSARYFKCAGDRIQAVDLLIESGQFKKAAAWIEEGIPELIALGRTGTVLRWQQELPPEYRKQPWFLLARAVSCRFTDPPSSLALFEEACKGFRIVASVRRRDPGLALALCGLIEACFHTSGDFARMGRSAAEANSLLARNKKGFHPSRARLLLAIGMACFFTGRLRDGSEAIEKALVVFRRQKDHFYQITCAVYLAPCALYQGDFRLAREALGRGFEALEAIPDEAGGKAALFLIKAMAALFEGNFQEAQENIDQCRRLADLHSLQSIGFLSLDIEGWLKIAQGEYAEAERLLTECKRKGENAGNHFFSASAAHLLAITHLFRGRLQQAKKESDSALAIRSQNGSRLFHAIYLIASGAIHLRLGRLRQAEKDLVDAVVKLQKIKALQQEANAQLMLALLYEKKRDERARRDHLRQGFSIGRRLGFTYYALLKPEELSDLARKAAAEDICADYCTGLADGRSAGVLLPLLTVHCMGGFRVFRGRTMIRESQWKSRRAKTLLKLLVAYDGKLPRDRAAELLWPGTESENTRHLFNSMLHRLRKVIEPRSSGGDISCIHQEEDMIALNKDRVWTDVRQFRHHLKQADRLKAAGRTAELMSEYDRIVELYTGDFLPENQYADWTIEVRDELRTRYLGVLQDAAALAQELGEKNRALRMYETLFLADSCSEKACRWLMSRHASAGQRSEAVRTYERCERALSRELDLEPEEKTKKIYRSIIGG